MYDLSAGIHTNPLKIPNLIMIYHVTKLNM